MTSGSRSGSSDPSRVLRAARSPLPWLAALLLVYLLAPVAAYVGRLGEAASAPTGSDLDSGGLGPALAVSVETATIATLVIAVLGVPLGYLLARGRGRAATLLTVLVQLPLALPPLMSGILLLYIVGPYTPLGRLFDGRLTDDRVGIVLAQMFVSAPFCVVAARSAFLAVDPALDDVAATLGHGRWSRFTRAALPVAAAGIGAGLLLTWLRAFGEFGATVVLAYHPYSLPVFTYVQFGSAGLTATLAPVGAGLVAAVVLLVVADLVPRLRRRRHRARPLPSPRPPAATASPQVALDLEARLGRFRLRLSSAPTGRHLAVLGPSGAGKTLTLRLIAGLVAPERGAVLLDGVDVTRVAAEDRSVGYVPQDSALLPHLPVASQVCFGVGADPALAAYWIARLRLGGLEDRLPAQLSGGQARRVALARALAREPRLLLLDEPFTGLDTPVRADLRDELRRLQRDTALTTVLVTHDPVEAAQLADEVLVVARGRLLQAGRQPDVFAHPATPQVARLLGVRNLGVGRVTGPDRVRVGDQELRLSTGGRPLGQPVVWAVPPERVRLSPQGAYASTLTDRVRFSGYDELVLALPGAGEIVARTSGDGDRTDLQVVGGTVRFDVDPDSAMIWSQEPTAPPDTEGADPERVSRAGR